MTTLFLAVFIASVLGSLHCAGMCGAFLAFAIDAHNPNPTVSRFKLQAAYHLGRLTTYTLLGAAAGATGALLNLSAELAGIQPIATGLAGALILAFGLITLLRILGVKLPAMPLPQRWQKIVAAGQTAAFALKPLPRAASIGLLTTLLPCGWLYAFAITAAGTASPTFGALTMAAFWLGTLPVLIALGTGIQQLLTKLTPRLGSKLPALTCVALIAVGLFTLLGRNALNPQALAQASTDHTQTDTPACCEPTTP